MNKNRFILIIGLLSVLLVAMAVSRPLAKTATAVESRGPSASDLSDYHQRQAELNSSASAGAGDFYQRHPDRASGLNNDFYQKYPGKWVSRAAGVTIPVTGSSAASDYFQRHPELIAPAGIAADVTDYFLRHPELSAPMDTIDLSDYFLRH
jgi:hypothetical protein